VHLVLIIIVCILSLEIGLYLKLINLFLNQISTFNKLFIKLKNNNEDLFLTEVKKLFIISFKLLIYFIIMIVPIIALIIIDKIMYMNILTLLMTFNNQIILLLILGIYIFVRIFFVKRKL